jgi:hypothetical protein
MKECNECGESKELTEFAYRADTNKYRNICKGCKLIQQKSSDALKGSAHKRYHRDWKLKKTYGISIEDYEEMLDKQGGCCAICSLAEKHAPYGVLSVDHCHDSGAVRALLCNPCNAGIGLFKENQDFLANAIIYLKRYNA